jgi:hypothetical protein
MAKKNAFNPQHQNRGGEQQTASGVKFAAAPFKKEIKTEEKPIIVDDIKSKYTVSNKPIRVYVYFYEENGELKYTLDKAVVSGKKFEEEWFEFNRDTWMLKELIQANSLTTINGDVVINPFSFVLAQVMFLLKDSSIKLDLKFSEIYSGIKLISNIGEIFNLSPNEEKAKNDNILFAIIDCIKTFYRG